jgi:glycerol-3-phosphate dehydrogenase (NAD(P)+)
VNLSFLGAGAWGTALAATVADRHPTRLWARDAAQAQQLQRSRCNERYLPGVELPEALHITSDFDAAVAHATGGLLFIATPTSALRETLRRLPAAVDTTCAIVWLCKGFEDSTGWLGHEVAHALRPAARVGVLSGPSFAIEVALGKPTALVAASTDAVLCEAVVDALHSDYLRIYTSADPVGVEVGGAVKNVLAIATGIADGMELGLNARAALITRGLAEMTRLGAALGARAETFMGLSGLGDLVLTATGDLSRNRQVGLRLAQGVPLARILADLGHVAEGVHSAATALQRARACDVDVPITEAVVGVIRGRITPAEALEQLMGRGARPEH